MPLFLAWDLVPRRLVGRLAGGLGRLYSWPGAALLILSLLAHWPIYGSLAAAALSPERCLAIFALSILSVLFHELGHAAAISRFGGHAGRDRVRPLPPDADLLRRRLADLALPAPSTHAGRPGGRLLQQVCFGAFAAAGLATGRGGLAACRMIDVMTLMTLNPLFRFDGYWLLVDYLGIPKLQAFALRYPGYLLRRLAGRPATPPAMPPAAAPARLVLRSYAALSGLFLVALLGLAARSLHGVFLAFPVIVPAALAAARAALAAGDVPRLVYQTVVLLLLLTFPASALLGLGVYLRGAWLWCAERFRGACGRRTGILRKRDMNITLAHPPLDDPTLPYHSTAYLAGHLAHNGFRDVPSAT